MQEGPPHTETRPQIERLLAIMARLRDPASGCEWDIAQDFASIAPYTIEEAYEVADAIERNDLTDLKDELGDLLLQVVFHARMAEEAGAFDFEDVVRSISDKMEARHPHIFGNEDGTMEEARWENLKEAERAQKGAKSALDGVALALPALMRAQKLQKRAARTGFDWPDTSGSEAKISEEIEELKSAATGDQKLEEAGDLLFAVVNFVRAHGIEAEDALRAANSKFEKRFRAIEALGGDEFPKLSLDQQEELWQAVKKSEI
ncbi:nucleoside triphosphate pyrophosphohydrolase [Erythrobacter sp. THAF29]|uniref:nucleoside triphosphate pyrophosphohydrolase n=1 Tax=Erythrobacter sp. THAF29 TaxID=2587851 RepID=UPI0012686EC8|nr:nucleoside triphosphate pyrophosphohydrolase [Erythrobacter sp. THAF29]QFT77923.1 Nucleoside triphosphate pyrophosphohydrolase [Erythrobacter sp. THAF29]